MNHPHSDGKATPRTAFHAEPPTYPAIQFRVRFFGKFCQHNTASAENTSGHTEAHNLRIARPLIWPTYPWTVFHRNQRPVEPPVTAPRTVPLWYRCLCCSTVKA